MTSPDLAFRRRKPNRAERRAARSRKATGKTVTLPRHAAGVFNNGQAVSPYDGGRELDAMSRPDRLRPTT